MHNAGFSQQLFIQMPYPNKAAETVVLLLRRSWKDSGTAVYD